jgi:glutamine---fructose-6-phosphate transaminase (isomerizing)
MPDPETPLPGAPDPWRASATPAARPGPPYLMTEMIAAEPGLAERLLVRLADPTGPAGRLAQLIRTTAGAHEPIVVTGCGTSEHGALGFVEIVRSALADEAPFGALTTAQAFEAALEPQRSGLLIAISHEGATWATNQAITAAHEAGAQIALVTVSDRSPAAAASDLVLATEELDQSWCHTIGYLAPLVAAAAVAGHMSAAFPDPGVVRALLSASASQEQDAGAWASSIAGARQVVVVGSGADRVAGRELGLKIEEGAWMATAYRDLETFLHGHLAGTDADTALVLILADRTARADRAARTRQLLAAAQVVGLRSGAILAEDLDDELPRQLTPAGRLVVREAPELSSPVAALLGTATPLQLLTERIARARGTNPDPIRRNDERYRRAAEAAE